MFSTYSASRGEAVTGVTPMVIVATTARIAKTKPLMRIICAEKALCRMNAIALPFVLWTDPENGGR